MARPVAPTADGGTRPHARHKCNTSGIADGDGNANGNGNGTHAQTMLNAHTQARSQPTAKRV